MYREAEIELSEDEIIQQRKVKRQKLMEELEKKGLVDDELPETADNEVIEDGLNEIKPTDQVNAVDSDSDSASDDMFGSESSKSSSRPEPSEGKQLHQSMLDNWDDIEGYYRIIPGELIDGRYQVVSTLGKGVFAAVVRAIDVDKGPDHLVAVKIIRNNETMMKEGLKEIELLKKLNDKDPQKNRNVVSLLRSFEHKSHLCLVFENLDANLRDVLKKFGRDVGLNIQAIRQYTQQMVRGLDLLKECQIIHADIKPDNILVDDSKAVVKIADLGSASDISENEITPYLVSRFYRAPELILGLPYDYSIDMWSLGCSLYELYTGKILFPGQSNNQMLKLMMELKGKLNHRMVRKGQFSFTNNHFNTDLDFLSHETDKVTGNPVFRVTKFVGPIQTMKEKLKRLEDSSNNSLLLDQFIDLLDKMLALNPSNRITPSEALQHPFLG